MVTRIYFASPLFSEMGLWYNAHVVDRLREELGDRISVYLPQENQSINDKRGYADSIMIADGDTNYIKQADLLVAVMDGVVIDNGVSTEIGVAFALDKPIIGIYSDTRQGTYGNQEKIKALDSIAESQFSYVNLYTVGLVKKQGTIVRGSEDMITLVKDFVKGREGLQ